MKLIPFKWLPASWGLRGRAFQRAEAEYLYEGEVLERHLLDIDHEPGTVEYQMESARIDHSYGHIDAYTHELRRITAQYEGTDYLAGQLILLDHAHGKISDYDRDRAFAANIEDEIERQVELAAIDAQYGVIEAFEAEKKIATLRNEPWVGGPSGTDDNGEFRFELDWNDLWIVKLREAGYDGMTDEIVMKKWFADICYNEVISANPDGIDPLLYDTAREALRRSFKEQ